MWTLALSESGFTIVIVKDLPLQRNPFSVLQPVGKLTAVYKNDILLYLFPQDGGFSAALIGWHKSCYQEAE